MRGLKSKKFCIVSAGIILTTSIFAFIYYKTALNKPNIILVTIDALRSDHLSCYGYKRNTSPNIDRLIAEGTVFTQAITAGGWTLPSVPSILTGTYSFIHRVMNYNSPRNPSVMTLAQILKANGFSTVLFTNHQAIEMTDIKDGFDLISIDNCADTNDRQLSLQVTNWINKNKNKPYFIYLHYTGAHPPYRPPEPYKSKFLNDGFRLKKEIPIAEDNKIKYLGVLGIGKIPYYIAENNISDVSYYIAQYDGAISFTDEQIGFLINFLSKNSLLRNTLVILTADHGEMLGEHGLYFCHGFPYECNAKVPLIIRFPKLFPKGKVISQQVSLIDIAPTILEIMRINIPKYIQGKSLLAVFKKNKSNLHPYIYSSTQIWDSLRSGNWKLIHSASAYKLYNINDDPQEKHNLVNEKQDKFKELKSILKTCERKPSSLKEERIEPLTDKQKEILKGLGYLQ